MAAPIVLDLDDSVGPLAGASVLDFRAWQERIRFGCGMACFREFTHVLDDVLPARYGTVFLGSGDFHHLTYALTARRAHEGPLTVVVLDNHPDNMRFPFGIHCGSWVRRVAALPHVSHIHVLGITSKDVALSHAWENYLTPLYAGKLTNWCVGVDVRWATRIGLGQRFRSHDCVADMLEAFLECSRGDQSPVYLSIDKDVLSPTVARTNWDQGIMLEDEMLKLVNALYDRLVASDITGEISHHIYKTAWKRGLSILDRQPSIDVAQLSDWRRDQSAINHHLLRALAESRS